MFRRFFTLAILTLATSVTWAEPSQCIDLFAVKQRPILTAVKSQAEKDFDFLYQVMRKIESDRYQLFPQYAKWTIYDFLNKIAQIHSEQKALINSHDFPNVPQRFLKEYKEQIAGEARNTVKQIEILENKFDLRNIKVEDILDPSENALMTLQSHVISLIVSPVTAMAELLVAVKFGSLQSTEENIPFVVPHWQREVTKNRHLLSPHDLAALQRKTVDILSVNPQSLSLIEVKFFGRKKEYREASGTDVLGKMSDLRKITNGNQRIRVILAIVGPGRLTQRSLNRYRNNSVEVIHITPEWSLR